MGPFRAGKICVRASSHPGILIPEPQLSSLAYILYTAKRYRYAMLAQRAAAMHLRNTNFSPFSSLGNYRVNPPGTRHTLIKRNAKPGFFLASAKAGPEI